MATISLHGQRLESMFELLGHDENDMTGSLGWALSQSSSFLNLFVREIGLPPTGVHEAQVRLQEYEPGRGFTDIEIELPGKLKCHLQDMTVMTGHDYRRYEFEKRTFRNQNLGPLVNQEMNRCIQCYRCVRYYRDYAGAAAI